MVPHASSPSADALPRAALSLSPGEAPLQRTRSWEDFERGLFSRRENFEATGQNAAEETSREGCGFRRVSSDAFLSALSPSSRAGQGLSLHGKAPSALERSLLRHSLSIPSLTAGLNADSILAVPNLLQAPPSCGSADAASQHFPSFPSDMQLPTPPASALTELSDGELQRLVEDDDAAAFVSRLSPLPHEASLSLKNASPSGKEAAQHSAVAALAASSLPPTFPTTAAEETGPFLPPCKAGSDFGGDLPRRQSRCMYTEGGGCEGEGDAASTLSSLVAPSEEPSLRSSSRGPPEAGSSPQHCYAPSSSASPSSSSSSSSSLGSLQTRVALLEGQVQEKEAEIERLAQTHGSQKALLDELKDLLDRQAGQAAQHLEQLGNREQLISRLQTELRSVREERDVARRETERGRAELSAARLALADLQKKSEESDARSRIAAELKGRLLQQQEKLLEEERAELHRRRNRLESRACELQRREEELLVAEAQTALRETATAEGEKARARQSRALQEAHQLCNAQGLFLEEQRVRLTRAAQNLAESRESAERKSAETARERNAAAKAELRGDAAKLVEEQARLAKATTKLEEEKTKLKEEKTKFQEEKTKLNEEKTKLSEEKTKLSEEKTKLNEEKTKLNEEKTKLNEEKTKLSEEKTKLSEEKTKLSEEKTKLNEEKTKLSEEKTKLNEEKAQLQEEKSKLQDEGASLRARREELEGWEIRQRAQQEELDLQQRHQDEVVDQMQRHHATLRDLQEELSQKQLALEEDCAKVQSERQEIEALQERLRSSDEALLSEPSRAGADLQTERKDTEEKTCAADIPAADERAAQLLRQTEAQQELLDEQGLALRLLHRKIKVLRAEKAALLSRVCAETDLQREALFSQPLSAQETEGLRRELATLEKICGEYEEANLKLTQRLREQDGLAERKRIEQNQTLQLQREEVDRLRFLLFSKQEQFEEQLESHEQLAKQQQLKIEGLEADLAQAREELLMKSRLASAALEEAESRLKAQQENQQPSLKEETQRQREETEELLRELDALHRLVLAKVRLMSREVSARWRGFLSAFRLAVSQESALKARGASQEARLEEERAEMERRRQSMQQRFEEELRLKDLTIEWAESAFAFGVSRRRLLDSRAACACRVFRKLKRDKAERSSSPQKSLQKGASGGLQGEALSATTAQQEKLSGETRRSSSPAVSGRGSYILPDEGADAAPVVERGKSSLADDRPLVQTVSSQPSGGAAEGAVDEGQAAVVSRLRSEAAVRERLLQVRFCTATAFNSDALLSSSRAPKQPVNACMRARPFQSRVKALENQVQTQRVYYQRRLNALSNRRAFPASRVYASAADEQKAQPSASLGGEEKSFPPPQGARDAETKEADSSRGISSSATAPSLPFPSFPLLHEENPALGTLFAFWQNAELALQRSEARGSLEEAVGASDCLGRNGRGRRRGVFREAQLKRLLAWLFPKAFDQRTGDPLSAADEEAQIHIADFQKSLRRVGCLASRAESEGAWLLLTGASGSGNAPPQLNAVEDASIDGHTLLRRAKQSAPTFLFFHYSLLLQRLQDQQQKKKLLKATAVLLQRQLRESRERQTEAELRLEGFQKLQQQQALESAAAAQCAPNLFSAAMPLALQPPSLFGGHTNLPFGAEGARPLQTATASIASAIRPRPQPPPPRDATEAQERVLDLQRQLLLLSERVRGKLAEHQRQQEEQRGVPVDRPPQRLDARSRQRVL